LLRARHERLWWLAHGGPVIGNGRELLVELVDAGGRTAFEFS